MTLAEAAALLRKAGIPDATREARDLFAAFSGLPLSRLYGDPSVMSDDPVLTEKVRRRAAREPLQYLLGEVGFFRETYTVAPGCLIPRADTETLVEYAVSHLPVGARVLDLCTGSGCIAISTARNVKDSTAVAVDLSADALAIARTNAGKNGVASRVSFLQADLFRDPLPAERFDAILSNPPYISREEMKSLAPELAFEPQMALYGGEDGGDFYRLLVPKCLPMLKPGGFLAFEIGATQSDLLRALAAEADLSCEILTDLASLPRVAVLRPR